MKRTAEQVCGSVKNELIISLLLLGGMAISLIASLACLGKLLLDEYLSFNSS